MKSWVKRLVCIVIAVLLAASVIYPILSVLVFQRAGASTLSVAAVSFVPTGDRSVAIIAIPVCIAALALIFIALIARTNKKSK